MADENIDYAPAPVDSNEDPEIAAVQAAAAEADAVVAENNQTVDDQDPFEAARLKAEEEYNAQEPEAYDAKDLGIEEDSWLSQKFGEVKSYLNRAALQSEDARNAASEAATIVKAKAQATLQARYKQPGNNDWRVRLVLAEGSDYLYNANPPGILKPLLNSNGVIFPYTPQISTAYTANYDKYDLTHSNYRGYFYKNSAVNDLNITATFTAQDTQEAEYLLAVIHFFRSATKMFYGKDAQRGAPPPLVYLIGYGDFQFNGHPCLIANFSYNLPHDVDYIRANNPNNYGTNMLNRRTATTSTAPAIATINRLANAIDSFGRSLFPGAIPSTPSPGSVPGSVNNLNRSTYVPTKMEIQLTLLPVQSRAQVSKQFSVKSFANGDGLKGGFW